MIDLERLLKNCRLSLDPEKYKRMEEDLRKVINWFEEIQKINTEHLAPALHPIEIKDVWRVDESEVFPGVEEILILTDRNPEGFIWGPRIKPSQK